MGDKIYRASIGLQKIYIQTNRQQEEHRKKYFKLNLNI